MTLTSERVKPFLRWAGGKQWISQRISKLIPSSIGTYFEPFLGGGSLFFATSPQKAVLSDLNSRLAETYQRLKDSPHEVIGVLATWNNDEKTYYRVRQLTFADTVFRAAQFIYLNKTCWNGLYRVNKQGEFNVPFGNNGRPVFDSQHLLAVSKTLQDADVRHLDFSDALLPAVEGDFVYLDPPYTSLHGSNGFRQYNERLFSWQDQQRLARIAVDLAERGCIVLVSNADHESILEMYPGFSCQRVARHSILAASSKFRRPTSELLISSDPTLLPQIHDEVIP